MTIDPNKRAVNWQTGIAMILKRLPSTINLAINSRTVQITQQRANSPLANKNLLKEAMSATGISQNSVRALDVAHLGVPEILDTAQLIIIRNITAARSDTKT